MAGKWCLPAGFVNEREDPTEAVVREVKEEAGIDVEITKSLGVHLSRDRNRLIHAFLCKAKDANPQLKAGSDAPDVGMFWMEELPTIAFPIHEMLIKDFFKS